MIEDRQVLPTNVKPNHYDLELTPNLSDFTFSGVVKIECAIESPTKTIQLNANELEIKTAKCQK